ncbi:hypothetical protein DY124_07565 [Apilactobacillus micheneri]|uniref:thioredoxin fold domain-containing protein n=1 Tax=Apilactobacillus micheneri TaxID=1899430 RepID=UPI00112B180E|nr:DUF6568 family protein [Apilactobacillus micheneri]TPR42354.1 hypothetical protein DY124_07565 [Apilactobacillus micheneri]TPR47075.1 hypothetical protein DY125_07495 [Apilactobacillus micheneri]
MNKKIVSFGFMAVTALSLGLTSTVANADSNNTNQQTTNVQQAQPQIPQVSQDQYEQNIQGVHNIDVNGVMNKINNKENFILFVGYKECKYCRAFSPELHKFIQKDNANVYYLNLDNVRQNPGQITKPFMDFLNKDLQLSGTPTIALLQNGKVNQDLNYSGYGFELSDLEQMLNK